MTSFFDLLSSIYSNVNRSIGSLSQARDKSGHVRSLATVQNQTRICAQSKLRSSWCLAKNKVERIYSCFVLKLNVCLLQSQHQSLHMSYKVLARAFTISIKLGSIPHVWKVAVLCMLIKPEKSPSQTTTYRPISLLSVIMKLFEWVIEKHLRKHLDDKGSFSKYQSGFRKSKSTNDHLFCLSQTIMESLNRGELFNVKVGTELENYQYDSFK